MFTLVKRLVALLFVLNLSIPLYAQERVEHNEELKAILAQVSFLENYSPSASVSTAVPKKTTGSFLDFINKKAFAATIDKESVIEEKIALRKKWEELLKVDIFLPYFKAEEAKQWITNKTSVEFFNIKGHPEFKNDEIKYIFKSRF